VTGRRRARLAGPVETARRLAGVASGRLRSLPILALHVHSACNCRCVMCDIWKANAERREIPAADLDRHASDIRRLRVRRVMLTGGEPLLHANLWALGDRLKALGIRVTLVTTGLLLERHAEHVARVCDDVVISVDGDRLTHDEIRRVPNGFDRIGAGVAALRARSASLLITGRSVVQRRNCGDLVASVLAAERLGLDRISFLAADVSTTAFNRPEPWDAARQSDVALGAADLARLDLAIDAMAGTCRLEIESGFVEGGLPSVRAVRRYYAALLGRDEFPAVRCNAPWVSAVLEPDGTVRPCFFHPPYGRVGPAGFEAVLNAPGAIAFRQQLDVATNATCRRCVCSLRLPIAREA
jgi:MoaA/NifB/PqqE/SkfB family radical SAM enzyme